MPEDFLNFFIGQWSGEGEFANGKKIAADLSIKLSLDSCWLHYEHTDRSPNRYKALNILGLDQSNGEFLAYTFDNFHGHRQFVSEGWKNEKLLLTTSEFVPQRGVIFQHFIFEKQSPTTFKMTYETSSDAISWKLGDSLIFTKNK